MSRNKLKNPLRLEGRAVILEEIAPKFFPEVIKWRNNPELNKFLNQPFKLTQELEQKWYTEKYLPDDTQGFMIMLDKATETPFGTTGWANMDLQKNRCTAERLLLGDSKFRTSAAFFESFIVMADYLYSLVDNLYGHVVIENTAAIRMNKMYGFVENRGEIQFPKELLVNGMKQREYFRTREMYEKARADLLKKIEFAFEED